MKKQKQPPSKLTTRYGSHHLGERATFFLLWVGIISVAVGVSFIGSAIEPDFWEPANLVERFATLIFFAALSLPALACVGYSLHFFFASVDAAVHLIMEQANQSLNAWLTSDFIVVTIGIDRFLPSIPAVTLKSQIRAFLSIVYQRLTSQRPKSKAPILLFQQAPLLVAP